jgi:hypothetical protein
VPGNFFIGVALRITADAGWVSIYYPPGVDYQEKLSNLDLVNSAELTCISNTVSCPRIWVSDMEIPGDVVGKVPQKKTGDVADAAGNTDPSFALVIKQQAGTKQRSTRFLRGVPEKYFVGVDPAIFSIGAPDMAPFTAYLAALKGGFLLISRPGKRNNNTFTQAPISIADLVPFSTGFKASIRRAGRPFVLRRGRRQPG